MRSAGSPASASAVSGRKNITFAAPWMNIGTAMVHASTCRSKPARMKDTSAKIRKPAQAIFRGSLRWMPRPMSGAITNASRPNGACMIPAQVCV